MKNAIFASLLAFISVFSHWSQASSSSSPQLVSLNDSQIGQKLIWSLWIEKVDGEIYQSVLPGIPSDSLVVYFQLSPNKDFVHLFEVSPKSNGLRGDHMIDRFPVVGMEHGQVVIDFSAGLKKRFFRAFFDPAQVATFEKQYSFVDDFKNEIDSVTFKETLKLLNAKDSTLIVQHAFRLFKENASFKPLIVKDPMKLGYMPATFSNSEGEVAIRRFDTSKPLTFFISSNTPAQYLEAVKEGILWWNKAFGFEFIKVEVLTQPVKWADARLNIFQWSEDPTFCGPAMAIGPSEANPITGEIYLGKILFCGAGLEQAFNGGIDPKKFDKADSLYKMVRWATSHELGHTLGFRHNFKGKLYQERTSLNEKVINSTVMDYPFPEDILEYEGVGPRDTAMIHFAYLGQTQELDRITAMPFCSDEELTTQPDCNTFARGGFLPMALSQRYIDGLENKASFVIMEHMARNPLMKQFFFQPDEQITSLATKLLQLYPGNKDTLIGDLKSAAEGLKGTFLGLEAAQQERALSVLSGVVLDFDLGFSVEQKKNVVEIVAGFKNYGSYKSLSLLASELDQIDPATRPEAAPLKAFVKKKQDAFWE